MAGLESIVDPRFAAVVRAGVDAATMRTWDPGLSRRSRLLVPVDVQAYVVAAGGAEPVVPLTGGAGRPGPVRGWVAVAGRGAPALGHARCAACAHGESGPVDRLTLPPLPDRWVVVRTVQPIGARRVDVHGWVIDAAAGSVTPLESYSGPRHCPPQPLGSGSTVPPAAPCSGPRRTRRARAGSRCTTRSPTCGARDGSVPTGRWHTDQAVYTVAGWWSDLGEDPVSGVRGPAALDARLTELRWFDGHDSVADKSTEDDEDDPVLPTRAAPRPSTTEELHILSETLVGADIGQGVVGVTPKEVVFTSVLPQYATLLHGSVLGVPVAGRLPAGDDRPDPADLGVAVGHDLDDVVAALGARVLGLSAAQRQSAETLVAAFTSGLIERLGSPDGLEDLAEREHGDTFWALAGRRFPAPNRIACGLRTARRSARPPSGARARAAHAADALGGTKLGWSGGPSPAPRPVRDRDRRCATGHRAYGTAVLPSAAADGRAARRPAESPPSRRRLV